MAKPSKYEEIEELFVELMSYTIKETLKPLKEGKADAKEIRNAITLLKDNGFTMRDIPSGKDPQTFLEELSKQFPQLPNISSSGEILDGEIDD